MTLSPVAIALLGTVGSYHHQVATLLFPQAEPLYCETFEGIIEAVREGRAHKGIVAVANSTIGDLATPHALLRHHAQDVVAERYYTLPIQHCLVVAEGVRSSAKITTVTSHPAALAQCRGVIARRGWHCHPATDTATAVRDLMANPQPTHAAIASAFAAQLYGAYTLPDVVQERSDNATTFAVITATCIAMGM